MEDGYRLYDANPRDPAGREWRESVAHELRRMQGELNKRLSTLNSIICETQASIEQYKRLPRQAGAYYSECDGVSKRYYIDDKENTGYTIITVPPKDAQGNPIVHKLRLAYDSEVNNGTQEGIFSASEAVNADEIITAADTNYYGMALYEGRQIPHVGTVPGGTVTPNQDQTQGVTGWTIGFTANGGFRYYFCATLADESRMRYQMERDGVVNAMSANNMIVTNKAVTETATNRGNNKVNVGIDLKTNTIYWLLAGASDAINGVTSHSENGMTETRCAEILSGFCDVAFRINPYPEEGAALDKGSQQMLFQTPGNEPKKAAYWYFSRWENGTGGGCRRDNDDVSELWQKMGRLGWQANLNVTGIQSVGESLDNAINRLNALATRVTNVEGEYTGTLEQVKNIAATQDALTKAAQQLEETASQMNDAYQAMSSQWSESWGQAQGIDWEKVRTFAYDDVSRETQDAQQRLGVAEPKINDLQTRMGAVETEADLNKTASEEQASDITTLQGRATNLEKQQAADEADIKQNTTSINKLIDSFNSMSSQMAQFNQSITVTLGQQTANITKLTNSIVKVSGDVCALGQRMTEDEASILNNANTIDKNAKKEQDDYNDLSGQIEKNRNNIADNLAAIAANKANIASNLGQINHNAQDILRATAEITDNSNRLDKAEARLDTDEKKIEQNSGAIDQHTTSIDALNLKMGKAQDDIQENVDSIGQINSTITKDEARITTLEHYSTTSVPMNEATTLPTANKFIQATSGDGNNINIDFVFPGAKLLQVNKMGGQNIPANTNGHMDVITMTPNSTQFLNYSVLFQDVSGDIMLHQNPVIVARQGTGNNVSVTAQLEKVPA